MRLVRTVAFGASMLVLLGACSTGGGDKPTVKIGLIEGKPVEPSYVKRLGELPPREVLLAQFAGCLNGVLYQVVATLEAFRDQRLASNSTEN